MSIPGSAADKKYTELSQPEMAITQIKFKFLEKKN